jgi:hypothetical protein
MVIVAVMKGIVNMTKVLLQERSGAGFSLEDVTMLQRRRHASHV